MQVLCEAHNVLIGKHHCFEDGKSKAPWAGCDEAGCQSQSISKDLQRQTSTSTCSEQGVWYNENLEEDYNSSLSACASVTAPAWAGEASEAHDLACAELLSSKADAALASAQLQANAVKQQVFAAAPEIRTRSCNKEDLLAQIRGEQEREADLRPECDYLEPQQASGDPEAVITPQMRMIVTSWMCEVAAEYRLQQETLFLAVALLDRFLSASPGVPRSVLQLVAVSCIFLASKQEAVSHPTVEELTDIAANCFQKEDLLRMEMILLDNLNWRIKSPTAYGFLHLLCQGLEPRLPPVITATAAYLTELSLLDYSALRCAPSVVAGAAILLAQATHSAAPPSWASVQQLTGHSPAALQGAMRMLLQLQHYACASHMHEAYQPLLFVRDKYAVEGWLAASVRSAPLLALPAAVQPAAVLQA